MSSTKPLNKTFVITMFGEPFAWIQQYIDHVQHLEKYGWSWKIFTAAKLESKGNVEIVPMTAEQYASLVQTKLGLKPNLYIEKGIPSVHITDFYIFSGVVFEDYLKEADFWGITNLDVVYGRLDHYLPDEVLADCDIFTDDVASFNGVFSLLRNTPEINNLFRQLPWEQVITQPVCVRCTTSQGMHNLFGSDEYMFTELLGRVKIRLKHPTYYPLHSYDRLLQHLPNPNLELEPDGALCEIFEDSHYQRFPGNPLFSKGHYGREIMYYHFLTTKKWPIK